MEYNDRDDFIKGTFKYNSLVACVCYRPHPKDDGRLYFHFVYTCRGGGQYPVPGLGRGVPHLRSGWRVPHPRFRLGGWRSMPISGLGGGGVPHPRSGGTPSQVLMVGYLRSGWWEGYPIQGLDGGGVLHLRSGGYPISGFDWGYPPTRSGWWRGTLGPP